VFADMGRHNPITRFEVQLSQTLPAVKRILLDIVEFGLFLVGLYVVVILLIKVALR
jgi:hypothetical protein